MTSACARVREGARPRSTKSLSTRSRFIAEILGEKTGGRKRRKDERTTGRLGDGGTGRSGDRMWRAQSLSYLPVSPSLNPPVLALSFRFHPLTKVVPRRFCGGGRRHPPRRGALLRGARRGAGGW